MAEPTPASDSRLNRLRLPAALLLAFLLMVGAYYTLHYRTNAEYLASRNFRLLATLATQVTEAVRNEGLVFGNVAGPSQEPSDTERLNLEKLSPRITSSNCTVTGDRPPDQTTGGLKLWRTLGSSDGAYRLSFQSRRGEEAGVPLVLCGEVELQELLDPLFSSREAFNAVLLANSAGKVVYLHGPKSLRVEQLNLLIQSRQEAKGEPGKDGKGGEHGFNAFQGYSRSAEVQLGGRFYTTFVQPFSLSLASMETGASGKPNDLPEVWLLAGLVAKDELGVKSLALSPSFVAFLLGVLLLAALAWPLVKLKLLGERQRVKKTDVLLVAVCSLLGVSIATLFVLDIGVYRTLKDSSEMQLKDFADQMESNLLVEIRKAYGQLGELEKRERPISQVGRLSSDDLQQAPYPDFESFALIDGQGQQVFKWVTGNSAPPISVTERRYFQRVHQGLTLNVPEPGKPKGPPFFLESVQSWTNGKWQAVIAKPVDPHIRQTEPPAQVAALAIKMLSVINPVVPQGFEFAVVGDDGTVLFHSDSARNGAENFFEETEHDRRFKSIVFARHDEPFNVRYWGESYRAVAIPVKGLPWTIVAMRNQQVLERVNLDWLVTTLIFVLLYTGAITLALIAIALLRPGYRAGWAWPDSERRHDYVKLIAIFAVLCLAFLTALFGLCGTGHLFAVAGLLPMLSLVAAYLKLSPAGNRKAKQRAADASGLLLLALLWLALYKAPMEIGAGFLVKWTVFALGTFACLLTADGPRRWRELQAGARMPISRSYPMLGLLLVLLGAVLPTAGFFKVAHRLQFNSFVRNGQLRMAKDLYDRLAPFKNSADPASLISRLTVARGLINEDPATLRHRSEPSLDFYGWAFFNTTLSSSGLCDGKPEEFEFLAGVLPPYSQYTAENREMLHNLTSDDDWKWCESADGDTVFDGENYLGVSLASKIEPMSRGNGPILAMAGLLPPQEIPEFPIDRLDPVRPPARMAGSLSLAQMPRVALALFALSLFGIPLYALVIFVARRIFLLDVQEPLWAGRTGNLPAMVGANVLLISRTQKWRIHDRESFFCMSFRDLDEGENGWPTRRLQLVRDPNRTVLVEGFEHRVFDPVWNARKLALLEEIVFVHQRAVVVLSELSPAVLFSPAGLPVDPTEDRWRTLLASFTQIDEDVWPPSERQSGVSGGRLSLRHLWEIFRIRRSGKQSGGLEKPVDGVIRSQLLRRECGQDLFLKRIGLELDPYATSANDEQVLEELGERAQGYYGAIWASCSSDERVVLGHLAEEGLINAKNRRIVRRLMARGLVERAPNLCLMNETFRRFVVSPRCREEVLSLEQAAGRSAWDRFHWPFSVALAACAALILVTQQELLDSTVATVTGVTAGLPTLLKLLDMLGWKRGVKGA
jgi:hypothetical protein